MKERRRRGVKARKPDASQKITPNMVRELQELRLENQGLQEKNKQLTEEAKDCLARANKTQADALATVAEYSQRFKKLLEDVRRSCPVVAEAWLKENLHSDSI